MGQASATLDPTILTMQLVSVFSSGPRLPPKMNELTVFAGRVVFLISKLKLVECPFKAASTEVSSLRGTETTICPCSVQKCI